VTLAADVNFGVVSGGEIGVGRQRIVIGRGQRVAELGGIAIGLMRVVTGDANHADHRVADGQRLAVDETQARRARVAPSALVEIIGAGQHPGDFRSDLRMIAGAPLVVVGRIGAGVAAAADVGRHFNPWSDGGVIRIGRVIGGGAVAVLALNAGQLGSLCQIGKAG